MTRNETFNGLREFPIPGHYFELISTVSAVDVTVFGEGDRVLSRELQVSQGWIHDRRGLMVDADGRLRNQEPFTRVEITTGANEAVKFAISDALTTNRSVPADITDRAARLLGIVYGALGQLAQAVIGGVNALAITIRGFAFATAFKSTTALAAGATEQVFAAAANVNGAIVWNVEILTGPIAIGTTVVSLQAHTAAPVAYTDGDPLLVAAVNTQTLVGSGHSICERLEAPVFIAAGKGLWFLASLGGVIEGIARRKVFYNLL